ncbi:hypothetical protein BDV26DRAFT_180354 [Aspergillus bertholletiae]|uniref:Uncharacterized protein n=1 Tax=Aspergillus bertholletiae TaxID=1226010 RepID=A0A5N7BML5_9EURO|nr:hypothetical protein BDV26DRAFT_180354 [Aspergillus bertholletiae]
MIISLGDFVGEISSTFITNMDMPISVWRAAHTLVCLSSGWVGAIVKACQMLEDADERDRRNFWNLIKMGTRRGAAFLGPLDGHPPRLFALSSPQVVLNLLRDDAECQIEAIRAVVRNGHDIEDDPLFIGYTHEYWRLGKWQEYATIVPIETQKGTKKHVRWVPADVAKVKHNAWLRLGEDYNITRFDEVMAGEMCELCHPDSLQVSDHDVAFYLPVNFSRPAATGKIPLSFAVRDHDRRDPDFQVPLQRLQYTQINDNATIAVYANDTSLSDFEVSAENLTRFFEHRYFDAEKLEFHLKHVWFARASPEYVRSMRALVTADQIYKLMPNATVSLSVLRKELGKQRWVPCEDNMEHPYEDHQDDEFVIVKRNRSGFEVFDVARSESFSCVALFETGTMDLSPDCFTNVMAISSGNSIFASGSILCDPGEDAKPHEIQRLVASIGKSGVSMLIPPMNRKLRQAEFDTWQLIDHVAFNGSAEDHFDNTSIQLSFTRYESPVPGAVFHGAQDVEANYVETLAGVIRAHDDFVGRLAATAISVQKGHLTFVLPKQICWTCIENSTLHSLDELSGGVFIG